MIQSRIAVGVVKGPTDPATGFKGKLFFNTSSDVLKVHDGSNWNVLDTGTADLVGPASSTDNAIVRFDGTTGKLCQNSVVTIADTTGAIAGARSIALSGSSSGAVTIQTAAAAGTWSLTLPANDGDSGQYLQTDGNGVTSWQTVTAGVGGSTGATDNRILRADGTGGATLQNSAATINDAGEVISSATFTGVAGTDRRYELSAAGLGLGNTQILSWAASTGYGNQGDIFNVADTGLYRNAPGVVEVNAGSAATSGGLLLRGRTFANVPATPVTGMMVTITDSNTATWGATIAGGGANIVLAFYNGTNWTVAGK